MSDFCLDYFDDLLIPLIENKSEYLGLNFVINDEKLSVVKELCEAINSLENEMSFIEFKAGFNDDTGKLEFNIITRDFLITNKTTMFHTLFKYAIRFEMKTENIGESIRLYFEYNNVWDYIE